MIMCLSNCNSEEECWNKHYYIRFVMYYYTSYYIAVSLLRKCTTSYALLSYTFTYIKVVLIKDIVTCICS